MDPAKAVPDPPVQLATAELEAKDAPLSEQQREELTAEIQRLKEAKQQAVEEEEYEEAAALKRRIKVLEDTLGEAVHYEARANRPPRQDSSASPPKATPKPLSQRLPGEDLWQMPSENMKLVEEERIFLQKSKMAMRQKGVTDDTVQGVPVWAYEDTFKEGPQSVRTERPPSLAYVFNGQIEDEKWEDGANFQASIVVQVPREVAFDYVLARNSGPSKQSEQHPIQVGPGAFISHWVSGIAQLSELLGSEVVENEAVAFRMTMTKPKVPGKVKLEAAKTVRTKEPFRSRPFYSFRSIWKLHNYPAGGTRVTRVVKDFKQFELFEFDALTSISRSIEVENEEIRQSWSSAVTVTPDKTLAKHDVHPGEVCQVGILCVGAATVQSSSKEMYSASFLLEAPVNRAFHMLVNNELLAEYQDHLCPDSYIALDEMRSLIRRVDGIVLFVTSRAKADMGTWTTMTIGHRAGPTKADAMRVTSENQVLSDPLYRVVSEWHFRDDNGQTLVRRSMRDFVQMTKEVEDLPAMLTEAADLENRKIIKFFSRRRAEECGPTGYPRSTHSAMSVRANFAMRQIPAILDHAAKNNVLEVRELLEIRGADPNYIHVRKDSWSVSDTRLEFYEEITPLVVAAEFGACDVIKVLFNHPQLDTNLCCCAFNDSEIYNYYTAYDMTISRKHPHAAALLRARGVLPASDERVYKPPFDSVHGRPLRETLNHTFEEDSFGAGEMPRWDTVAQGDPELALELSKVAETLSMTKSQTLQHRGRIFKGLISDWHPDRHAASGNSHIATKIFQWLQVVKSWYLEEQADVAGEQQPLPGEEEFGPPSGTTQEYMHPSGNLFSVW